MLLLLFTSVLLWVMISAFEIASTATAPSRRSIFARHRHPQLLQLRRRYPSGHVLVEDRPRLSGWMSPLPTSEDGNTASSSSSSSSSSVPFNPFQYDATSVRMNRDRIQRMSNLQQQQQHHHNNHGRHDGNDTLNHDVPTVSNTGTTKSYTLHHHHLHPDSYQISLRELTMKQIMNDMIHAVPDYDRVHSILQTNREFLLEPLEDDDTMAMEHSTPNDPRRQRYAAFSVELQSRIRRARNPSVQQILRQYHDFVMSHQSL
jgi:hypothetical protein